MQLLHLCEAESVSYLDEVASIPESLDLAKSVAVEVSVDGMVLLDRNCIFFPSLLPIYHSVLRDG